MAKKEIIKIKSKILLSLQYETISLICFFFEQVKIIFPIFLQLIE